MKPVERKRIRELTMGCFWSSVAFPRKSPDWIGIAGELTAMVAAEEFYFEDRGSNLAGLNELRALKQLAKDKVRNT